MATANAGQFFAGVHLSVWPDPHLSRSQIPTFAARAAQHGARVMVGMWCGRTTHVVCHDRYSSLFFRLFVSIIELTSSDLD